MATLSQLRAEIKKEASSTRAKNLSWFFKTGKGEYAEGDIFIGLSVPQSRVLAKKFGDISFAEKVQLLKSNIHEERMIALLMLIKDFEKGTREVKKEIFNLYIHSTQYINNWDLVDLSAKRIIGPMLFPAKNNTLLTKFARSKNLWERRIAALSTFYYIGKNEFEEPLRIAKILLNDGHDLIQKAVGWMIREIGNRSLKTEIEFLLKNYKTMPRTALRYAIEKFPESLRKKYLKGKA